MNEYKNLEYINNYLIKYTYRRLFYISELFYIFIYLYITILLNY